MIATAYDHDGNRRVQIELRVGDHVQWKRNGQAGSLRGHVRELRLKRVWLWLPDEQRYTLVKPRFLSIHRDGKRLP